MDTEKLLIVAAFVVLLVGAALVVKAMRGKKTYTPMPRASYESPVVSKRNVNTVTGYADFKAAADGIEQGQFFYFADTHPVVDYARRWTLANAVDNKSLNVTHDESRNRYVVTRLN